MFINTLLPAALHRDIVRSLAQASTVDTGLNQRLRGEIVERENTWELQLDLPGMDREDVEILIEGQELVVKGARNREAMGEKDRLVHSSRLFGSFERRYRLSDEIDIAGIAAHMDKGVLRITLSKAQAVLPRKVDIAVN
jgi:HSP20 family protein